MKILIVQDFLRSGGTERQSVFLASAFAHAGHPTHLITFRPGGILRPSSPVAGLTVRSLQRRDSKLDWWAPGLVKHAVTLAPDIILCMGRMANSYGGSLQKALPNTAVISTLRTGKKLPWAFRRSLQLTRHTIANSHAARHHLTSALNLPEDKTSVIPNGLVFGPASPPTTDDSEAFRAAHGASPDDLILIDVAMFRPEKNQIALVDMAARLPADLPWRLWLAGDGPARSDCERRAREHNLTDRVSFLGWSADPRPIYRAGDIAVHASKRESLSNFLIEAQAHGLPAVAAAARGVDETFLPGESGCLIEPDNLEQFADAVTTLLRDGPLRRSMGERGRQHAQARFSPDAQAQAHLDLFAKLTSLASAS